jgi:hypothetical protein
MAVDGIPDFLFCGGIHMVYSFKNSNEFHE